MRGLGPMINKVSIGILVAIFLISSFASMANEQNVYNELPVDNTELNEINIDRETDEINDENGPDRSYEHRYDSKYVLEAVDKVAEIYEYFMSFCLILLILTWFSVRFWQVCRKKLRASNSAK